MYIMHGMTREVTQEPGDWKSPSAMENVYNRTRAEDVAPEMRAAVSKARAILEVTSFGENLDREVCPDSDEMLGPKKESFVRIWFRLFCSVREYLVPISAIPIRENFWS